MNPSEFLTLLGRVSLQATVLTLLVLLIQKLWGRHLPPRWQSALWLLVVARLLLPVSLRSDASIFNLVPKRAAVATPAVMAVTPAMTPTEEPADPPSISRLLVEPKADSASDAVTIQPSSPAASPIPLFPSSREPVPEPVRASHSISWPVAGVASWLAGVLALSLHLLILSRRLALQFRQLPVVKEPTILGLLEECRALLGVRTRLTLVESADLPTPALHGVFRPRLILPRGLSS